MVSFTLWWLYSRGERLDWFQSESFGGQAVYLAPFGNRTTMSGSRSPQPAAWSLYPLSYSSCQHGSRRLHTAAARANVCITARIAADGRSHWLAYFLLLCRRRRITIVLLCSPCRIVCSVTCEPFIMSDTIFTSNISSKVV